MFMRSMDVSRRAGSAALVCVVLVCAVLAGSSEGSRRALQPVLVNGDRAKVGYIDEDTAEQIWINCRREVIEMKDYLEDIYFFFVWEAAGNFHEQDAETLSLRKRYWHAAVNDLSPQAKQTLLACSRSRRFHWKRSTSWIAKCVGSFLDWPGSIRRKLIVNPPQRRQRQRQRRPPSLAPASSLIVSPSPSPLGAASPSPLRAISPSPALVRSRSPSPSPVVRPPPFRAPKGPSPPHSNDPPPPILQPIQRLPPKPRPHESRVSDDADVAHKKKVLIALIASMSVATVVLAALLVYLLKTRKNKVGPRYEQKDDRPLLNLGSGNSSAGSSPNSQGLGNSSASGKLFGLPSGKRQSTAHASAMANGLLESNSSEAVSGKKDETISAPPSKLHSGKPVTPPPSAPPPSPPAPRPPPPPKGARLPPPPGKMNPPLPKGAPRGSSDSKGDFEAPKAKLKPFFWDKVQAADDHSMVWHELKAGSFQVNEEMMESLFGYAPMDKSNVERKKEAPSLDNMRQYIKIIDPKKAQNLSILLRALNVTTEEVRDALREGNELPAELIQTLIKMAPSADEELKLRLYDGDLSQLGPAERFLKCLVEIPHALQRLESLLIMGTYQEEVANIKEAHETLEVACDKIKNSRLFLKLLEAVLKTGNRMNDGTYRGGAQAFKLDTLLKLSDVKGTDGKTTLLHFVVQEMIRSEGIRAVRIAKENQSQGQSISDLKVDSLAEESAKKTEEYYNSLGLQVVSGLSTELEDVKKASIIDSDGVTNAVSKLGHALLNTRDFLNTEMKSLDEDCEFHKKLASFVEQAEAEVAQHIEEEKRIVALIKSTADYFYGKAGKDEGLRLFVIVRDFLVMVDKVCTEIKQSLAKSKAPWNQVSTVSNTAETPPPQTPLSDMRQRLFPAIQERRMDDSSSDDDSS